MTKGVQRSTNSSGWKVRAGQGVVKDEGLGASGWNHIKHPSPQPFLQPLFYMGIQGLLKLKMIYTTRDGGGGEQGQILGKATGSIKQPGIQPGDRGGRRSTSSPCPLQLEDTWVCAWRQLAPKPAVPRPQAPLPECGSLEQARQRGRWFSRYLTSGDCLWLQAQLLGLC